MTIEELVVGRIYKIGPNAFMEFARMNVCGLPVFCPVGNSDAYSCLILDPVYHVEREATATEIWALRRFGRV